MQTTHSLIKHCCSINYDQLPVEVVNAARRQVLDCLASGLAGLNAPGVSELIELNRHWGGCQESTVFGHDLALPAPHAAQVNATIMHARDYDDVHGKGLMHSGIISVASALAVAEMAGNISGKDFLAAVAMGTDLICRLGMAVRSDKPKAVAGWHFTSIFGFPTSAAVASRLIKLSPEQMLNAMGIAYHQSAGNGQCVLDGTLTKRLGPGFAVKGGITAALLAARGITGASGWLEGEAGMYRQYFREPCDEEVLLSGLGVAFEGVNVAAKRYGCCGIIHPFIDAALQLRKENKFDIGDIEKIRVSYGAGSRFMIEPVEAKRKPRNIVDSQFSVPWAVAAALVSGKVSLEHFTETGLADNAINRVCGMIEPVFDAAMTRLDGVEAGRLDLVLKDGKQLTATCENQINEGGIHMSFDECVDKFMDCAAFSGLPFRNEQLNAVVESIRHLEEMTDASDLIRLMKLP